MPAHCTPGSGALLAFKGAAWTNPPAELGSCFKVRAWVTCRLANHLLAISHLVAAAVLRRTALGPWSWRRTRWRSATAASAACPAAALALTAQQPPAGSAPRALPRARAHAPVRAGRQSGTPAHQGLLTCGQLSSCHTLPAPETLVQAHVSAPEPAARRPGALAHQSITRAFFCLYRQVCRWHSSRTAVTQTAPGPQSHISCNGGSAVPPAQPPMLGARSGRGVSSPLQVQERSPAAL